MSDLVKKVRSELERRYGKHIEAYGRTLRRFIAPTMQVRDHTLRCVFCGQIDDEPYHDMAACIAVPSVVREVRERQALGDSHD